jgi:hypothetical protein
VICAPLWRGGEQPLSYEHAYEPVYIAPARKRGVSRWELIYAACVSSTVLRVRVCLQYYVCRLRVCRLQYYVCVVYVCVVYSSS